MVVLCLLLLGTVVVLVVWCCWQQRQRKQVVGADQSLMRLPTTTHNNMTTTHFLCFHGCALSARQWDVWRHTAPPTGGARVHAYDRAGFGRHALQPARTPHQEAVVGLDWLRQRIQGDNVTDPWVIVGHSMGAQCALAAAHHHAVTLGNSLRGLVLVAPALWTTQRGGHNGSRRRGDGVPDVLRPEAAWVVRGVRRALMEKTDHHELYVNAGGMPDLWRLFWWWDGGSSGTSSTAFVRAYCPRNLSERQRFVRGLANVLRLDGETGTVDATRMLAEVAAAGVRVVVVHGTADPLVSVRWGRQAAAAAGPSARWVPLSGMGHLIPDRAPGLLWRIVRDAGLLGHEG